MLLHYERLIKNCSLVLHVLHGTPKTHPKVSFEEMPVSSDLELDILDCLTNP